MHSTIWRLSLWLLISIVCAPLKSSASSENLCKGAVTNLSHHFLLLRYRYEPGKNLDPRFMMSPTNILNIATKSNFAYSDQGADIFSDGSFEGSILFGISVKDGETTVDEVQSIIFAGVKARALSEDKDGSETSHKWTMSVRRLKSRIENPQVVDFADSLTFAKARSPQKAVKADLVLVKNADPSILRQLISDLESIHVEPQVVTHEADKQALRIRIHKNVNLPALVGLIADESLAIISSLKILPPVGAH